MTCVLNKPKVITPCTGTKGIPPCTTNKPNNQGCTTIKQILNNCKLTKPFCSPNIKMRSIPCSSNVKVKPVCVPLSKPFCTPSVKMNLIPCPPNVKMVHKKCTPLVKVNYLCGIVKPYCAILTKQKPIPCVDVKQLAIIRCGPIKPVICTINKPTKLCTLVKPKKCTINKPQSFYETGIKPKAVNPADKLKPKN